MIVGLGDLGGWVLELLARCEGVERIATADIREDYGQAKTMTAAVGASQQGFNKRLEFHKLDVNDEDRTAELLNLVKPDVLYSATTMQSWWVPYLLPENLAAKAKRAGVGPLTAGHIPLIHKLMLAVKKSGIKTRVLNNSFPDVINAVLTRNGLGPEIGSGNSDMIMEDIRRKVSYDFNVPPQEIAVFLYTAHAMCMQATKEDIPFFLKICVAGEDVTSRYDAKELVSGFASLYAPMKMTSWLTHPRVAASAVKNIMAMINGTNELTHVPGPNGLPGGYSVRVGVKGTEVVLPSGLTLEQAVNINIGALKYDGIEEIKKDGTIVFTDLTRQLTKEWLGADVGRELRLDNAREMALELTSLTKKVAQKHNVSLQL
jgi:hypothetical protein